MNWMRLPVELKISPSPESSWLAGSLGVTSRENRVKLQNQTFFKEHITRKVSCFDQMYLESEKVIGGMDGDVTISK